jgi:NAD(P)-dependent dehydrogenase (short-subunit alcohol dehydrogenase family)
MTSLDGQVCLLLGAGGGIGSAVARSFLDQGATLVAVDIDDLRLQALSSSCAAGASGRLLTVVADPGVWTQAEKLVDDTVATYGGIDVVLSCAGVFDQAVPLVEVAGDLVEEALTQCLRANVTSALHVIRAALPTLAERRGRVILTSSFAGSAPSGGGVFYTMAKHALNGMVKQLAFELAPHVRVNAVAPGVAATMMTGLSVLDQGRKGAVLDGTAAVLPLGVIPQLEDYTAVYSLLADPHASAAMTGSTVVVDSGLSVRGLGRPAGNTLARLLAVNA